MKIVRTILILVPLFFSANHGWAELKNTNKPEETKMMAEIGIGKNMI